MSNRSLFKITSNTLNDGKYIESTPKNQKKVALSPPPQVPDMKKYPFLSQIRNHHEQLSINNLLNGQMKKPFTNNLNNISNHTNLNNPCSEILTVSELNDTDTAFSSDMFSDNQSIRPIGPHYAYCANSDHENVPSFIQAEKIKVKKKKVNDDIGILIDYKLLSLSFIESYNKEKTIKEEEEREYSVDKLDSRCSSTVLKTEEKSKKNKRKIEINVNSFSNVNYYGSNIGSSISGNLNANKKPNTIANILFQQKSDKPYPVGIQPQQIKKKLNIHIPTQTDKDYINKNLTKTEQEPNLNPNQNLQQNINSVVNCNIFNKKQRANPIIIKTPDRKILDYKYPEIDIKHHSNQNKRDKEYKDFMDKRNFFSSSNTLSEKVFGTNNSTPTNNHNPKVISNVFQNTNLISNLNNLTTNMDSSKDFNYSNNNHSNHINHNNKLYFNKHNMKNHEISPINGYNNKNPNNPFPMMIHQQFNQSNNNQYLNYNDQNLNYMYPHLNYPYTGNQVFRENFNLDYNFGKILENFSPFPYSFKLHNDIVEYSSNVSAILNELKDIKTFIIKFITDQIKNLICNILYLNLYSVKF